MENLIILLSKCKKNRILRTRITLFLSFLVLLSCNDLIDNNQEMKNEEEIQSHKQLTLEIMESVIKLNELKTLEDSTLTLNQIAPNYLLRIKKVHGL